MSLKGPVGMQKTACPPAARSCVRPAMLYFLGPMYFSKLFNGLLGMWGKPPSSPSSSLSSVRVQLCAY